MLKRFWLPYVILPAALIATVLIPSCFLRIPIAAGQDPPTLPVVPKPLAWPKVIPWLEINNGQEWEFQAFWKGIRYWRQITDEVWITTHPHPEHVRRVYTSPYVRMCKMKVRPGLKGSPIFGSYALRKQAFLEGELMPEDMAACHLDELEKWQDFAASVRLAAELNPTSPDMLLEFEGALGSYIRDLCQVDVSRLQELVKVMPAELTYWCYPMISGAGPAVRYRQADAWEPIARGLRGHVGYFDNGTIAFGPHTLDDDWRFILFDGWFDAYEAEYSAPGQPRGVMIYTYNNERFWPYDRVPEAVQRIEVNDLAIVYPHADSTVDGIFRPNWSEGSKHIVAALLEAGYPRRRETD